MKASCVTIQFMLFCLASVCSSLAQTPDAELGIWSGSVVIKKSYAALGHTKISTLMVTGYVGSPGGGPDYFVGLITNLDSRENAKNSNDQTISLPVSQLTEGGIAGFPVGIGNAYETSVVPKTLRFTKRTTTNKMISIAYKAKGFETFALESDVVVEISVSLTWRKALPTSP